MMARCHNPRAQFYHRYGGRGIYVCAEWFNNKQQFLKDMGEPPEGMTLERDDNDGHYSPNNCRWATPQEQADNQVQPTAIPVTVNGVLYPSMGKAAKALGMPYYKLVAIVKKHGTNLVWSVN